MKVRYLFAFLPFAIFGALFAYLTIMTKWFSWQLFFVAVAFLISGVLICRKEHIFASIFAAFPVLYFILSATRETAEEAGVKTMFLWIAGGIALYYVCYYLCLFIYHRELKK